MISRWFFSSKEKKGNNDETLIKFIKQSTQRRGKGRTKIMDPNPNHKTLKPNLGVTKGQRNKICSKAPTNHKKHIKEGKGKEIGKQNKFRRTLTCDAFQNRSDMCSL
jgi:hypothetical protein